MSSACSSLFRVNVFFAIKFICLLLVCLQGSHLLGLPLLPHLVLHELAPSQPDPAPPPPLPQPDLGLQLQGALFLSFFNCIGTVLRFFTKEALTAEAAMVALGMAAVLAFFLQVCVCVCWGGGGRGGHGGTRHGVCRHCDPRQLGPPLTTHMQADADADGTPDQSDDAGQDPAQLCARHMHTHACTCRWAP